jgi:hypothetical protein
MLGTRGTRGVAAIGGETHSESLLKGDVRLMMWLGRMRVLGRGRGYARGRQGTKPGSTHAGPARGRLLSGGAPLQCGAPGYKETTV